MVIPGSLLLLCHVPGTWYLVANKRLSYVRVHSVLTLYSSTYIRTEWYLVRHWHCCTVYQYAVLVVDSKVYNSSAGIDSILFTTVVATYDVIS